MEEEHNIWEVIMKNYRITVNGVAYDVAVEEMGEEAATSAPAPAAAPKPAAPKAAPAAAGAGAVKINSPMPGNILSVKASAGQAVKKGDAVLVLEIMKMETPVVAPQDGTVASINVNVGDMVEAGALLATLN